MNKIYKYSIGLDRTSLLPKDHIIIRVDNIDGHWFVWAIVNPEDTTFISKDLTQYIQDDNYISTSNKKYLQIGLMEDQDIYLPSNCFITEVKFVDGKCYIFFEEFWTGNGSYTKYNLKGRKTGQELDFDPEEYSYIGCLQPWIKQELCVYVFAKRY